MIEMVSGLTAASSPFTDVEQLPVATIIPEVATTAATTTTVSVRNNTNGTATASTDENGAVVMVEPDSEPPPLLPQEQHHHHHHQAVPVPVPLTTIHREPDMFDCYQKHARMLIAIFVVICSASIAVGVTIHRRNHHPIWPACTFVGSKTISRCRSITNFTSYNGNGVPLLVRRTIPTELGLLTRLTQLSVIAHHGALTGPIPTELGLLTRLTVLDLSRNSLTGMIPSELGYLRYLTELNLGKNDLNGTLPQEIWNNLTALTSLDVQSDQFMNGTIPSTIQNLKNLTRLVLNYASLTGTIPSEIGNLDQLMDLQLSGNYLNGTIPTTIGNLRQLTSMGLTGNQLSGSIPSEIGNLQLLISIFFTANQLNGPIPTTLGRLQQLQTMLLDDNKLLSGTIPSSLCTPSLIEIIIDCNYISCNCCALTNCS